MSRLSTQAGAFLPRLLEQAGLLETSETPEKKNEAILELNVIIVYRVQSSEFIRAYKRQTD